MNHVTRIKKLQKGYGLVMEDNSENKYAY